MRVLVTGRGTSGSWQIRGEQLGRAAGAHVQAQAIDVAGYEAAVICDAVIRLLPGVLNDETSALSDSFQDGLIAPPVYTRPADFNGWKVPDILLSGHTANIEKWRNEQSVERTKKRRPGLS